MTRFILMSVLSFSIFGLPQHQLIEIGSDYYTNGEKIMLQKVKEEKRIFQIWPGNGKRKDDPAKGLKEESKVKGVLRIRNVDHPTLTWIKPEKPDGRAILIAPGGGYHILAASHEGSDVATWLAQQGITPFILKYRVPRRKDIAKHKVALEDAQRAMSLIRFHAKEFKIDKNKLGMLGFSAGGHLSALTTVQNRSYEEVDQADKQSCLPDFAVLVYSAYTAEAKINKLDPMLETTREIPIYSVIGSKDKAFLPGLEIYIKHLKSKKVPVKHSVYDGIGHGVGLINTPWAQDCKTWLEKLNL